MLFSKVEITKSLDDTKEIISFYILEEETYGIKISVTSEDSTKSREIHDISKDRSKVENLIEELMISSNDLEQLQAIIEDNRDVTNLVVA